MRKINDKAFSFIEIVVVIAIITILTVGSIFGLSALIGWKAKEFAKELETVVREARTDSMGRDAVVVEFTNDGENFYAQRRVSQYTVTSSGINKTTYSSTHDYEKDVLGKVKNLTVTVKVRKASDFSAAPGSCMEFTYDLETLSTMVLGFERTSGSFKKVLINGDEDYCKDDVGVAYDMYVYAVDIKQGSKVYTVHFEQLTGQVYTD